MISDVIPRYLQDPASCILDHNDLQNGHGATVSDMSAVGVLEAVCLCFTAIVQMITVPGHT
jgi:hypothetical protein